MTLILNAEFMSSLAYEQMRLRLSHQLRQLRVSHGWTRSQLAKRAHISMRDVWRVENGYLKHITIKTLTRLARALDLWLDIRFVSLLDAIT